ncbi:MAG TPA: PspC domain-containing protein [Spirillospora sp.]|nr:PspC domain-containing protein [Spirillospora sp.]
MAEAKKLYRSRRDRQIAGVCGGIAEYLNVDATVVRLVVVLLTLMGGPGLLLYLILALVIPEEPEEKPKNVLHTDDAE